MPGNDDSDNTWSVAILTAGVLVSHYRIIEKIGAGGMGEVYLAHDTELNRKVALKFLPPHLCQDADCQARFKREAQAAAKLDNPHIVTIYEVGEYQGRPFFAMQLVEGRSLRELASETELPVERALEIGIQVCEGLQAAHEKGIIHRDIKPSNILIDLHGRMKIVDFGLASVLGAEQLTKTGSTIGTMGYMSPEQVKGEEIDARSDIFSLGVTLYELMTGRQPFKGDTEAATLRNIIEAIPEPLARYKSGVSEELQRIIGKMLAKDKKDRYQHADDLLADLKQAALPHGAVPGSRKSRLRVIVPSVLTLVILVVALVLRPWKVEISPTQEAQAANNWLAVMYFDNISDPADSQRMGEIATNLLITGLSQSEYVKVVSSQRLYDLLKQMGKEDIRTIDKATASEVARRAGTKWMLTGSILQCQPTLFLTFQLVDVASGGVIASQRVAGNPGEDIFSIIDRLIEDVKRCSALPKAVRAESSVKVADVTTHSPEAYRYFLEGIEYWDKYYIEDARRAMRKAIEYDSTFAEAYSMLATTYFWDAPERKFATAQAMKFLDRASYSGRQRIIAIDYYLRGEPERAISAYQDYLRMYPDDKQFWYGLGSIYMDCKIYDSTVSCCKRALALDPSFRPACNILAYAFYGLGRQKEAIDAINTYIKLAPDEPNPYDSRGDLYAWYGHPDSALNCYKKALSIKADFPQSLRKKGFMEMFLGQYRQAETSFRAYFSSLGKPDRGYWRASLMYIPAYQGRFREALLIGDQCIAANKLDGMDSTNWVIYALKSGIYDWLGLPDSALAMIKMALTMADKASLKEAGLVSSEVVFSYEAGDTVAAKFLLDRLEQEAQSNDAAAVREYWDAKGLIALFAKEYDKAVEYLIKLDSLPSGEGGGYSLAEAYLYSGDRQKAIEILEKKLMRYDQNRAIHGPYSVKGYYLLGRAYDEVGEKKKAQAALERFLAIWKDADAGLKEVEDTRIRLARLKAKSQEPHAGA